ncbi:hypothetical protein OAU26_08615 [Mariniblastus sp.]|nr:hypothetical protein [Mariniblastus sp.]MDA7885190.1 hypothetical protein [bacterium]MDC3224982.1 hypothetical protein [Mariniblastus sp.]
MKLFKKLLKGIWTTILTGLFLLVFVAFGLNSFVRVSDGKTENGIGIVEEWLFGRSLISRVFESENKIRFFKSADLSAEVASIIGDKGAKLIDDSSEDSERIRLASMTRTAYELASSIPLDYLQASNPELPEMYTRHFVAANKLWTDGLTNRRDDLILEGIDHYNIFLRWMQSSEREDFNNMR